MKLLLESIFQLFVVVFLVGCRIAILHEGRLKCCGSPQFLKRAYDCGVGPQGVKVVHVSMISS